jgi:hypothetical protein
MSNQPIANDASSTPSAHPPTDGDFSNVSITSFIAHSPVADVTLLWFHGERPPSQTPARGLYAPSLANDNFPDDSIPTIVARLMNPPEYLYNNEDQTYTFLINWVVGIAGPERFQPSGLNGRHVLRREDELWEEGEEAGLSVEIMVWLKRGEETLTLPASHFE